MLRNDETFDGVIEVFSVAQSIIDENRSIDLSARDIALLLLIADYMQTQKSVALSITEQEIRYLSSRLDEIDPRELQTSEKRHTDSISRLIKGECLSRSDMSRLVPTGDTEYQLTTFGESIATWHFEHEQFSGEPLTAIIKAFNMHLLKISSDAELAENQAEAEKWRTEILVPMQVVLKDMLVNIHRHQRELDRRHEHLRAFIPKLLTESSEASIAYCEEQLAKVTKTIGDLQEVTLAAINTAYQKIDKVEGVGHNHGFPETEAVCNEIERKMEVVLQWTSQRAMDWIEHHHVVHDFLRSVVYLDRQRRITEALKRAVSAEPQWGLTITAEPPLTRFRDDMPPEPDRHKSPRRAKRVYAHEQQDVLVDQTKEVLQTILSNRQDQAEIMLSEVLRQACSEGISEGKLIFHLPWLLGIMAHAGRVDNMTRPVKAISATLEVEELRIEHDLHK